MHNYTRNNESKNLIAAPELPKEAQLPVYLGLDGCPWLDGLLSLWGVEPSIL